MSFEQTFESIAHSLKRIADHLDKAPATVAAPTPAVHVAPQPAATTLTNAPAVVTTGFATAQPTPQVAAPGFAAPVAAASPFGVDEQGQPATLTSYVMAAYRQMGPVKGAKIQEILVKGGYNNINEVKPEHYAGFFAAVEALKVAP